MVFILMTFGDESTAFKQVEAKMFVPEPREVCIAEAATAHNGASLWRFQCLLGRGTIINMSRWDQIL